MSLLECLPQRLGLAARQRVMPVRALSMLGVATLLFLGPTAPVLARPDEAMLSEFRAGFPELFSLEGDRRLGTFDVPDIFGPGKVLSVGHVYMKVTNFDIIGNPFPNLSTDPSAQWPGASGIEYLNFISLAVGGVNQTATDPAAVRRVSLQPEWRPQTLDAVDRIYSSYEGQVSGHRMVDDDLDANNHDPLDRSEYVDEDFLDGRDTDGDGLIDEDYGAIGQQMFSCVMWDNTPEAIAAPLNEAHIPLSLELRQTTFAFSVPGFEDFNVVNWQIFNRSGHGLDSMYVGIRFDMDAGPKDSPTYFIDDIDVPFFPRGDFPVVLTPGDPWGQKMDPKGYRRQQNHAVVAGWPAESLSLCPRVNVRVNGFSVVDNDGDGGRTPGIASILLLGHTIDPLGLTAPQKVGWTQFRSHMAGTPYSSGGNPVVDQQRLEMFRSQENIDPQTGFINATPVSQPADIQGWASVGPFGGEDLAGIPHYIPDGGSIELTIAFAVQESRGVATIHQYPADYAAYQAGTLSAVDLFSKYPQLENAFAAQVAYEGVYDDPPPVLNDGEHINVPDFHGRETRLRAPAGFIQSYQDCRDEGASRLVTEFGYTWFDFDCDYCTGVWVYGSGPDFGGGPGSGKMLRRWNVSTPPALELAFDFKPSSLALNSKGKWVDGYLRPPAPFLASQIDVTSIRLNDVVAVSPQYAPKVEDNDQKLHVKFSRGEVIPTLVPGDHVPVTVTGIIQGQPFAGTDYIKVKAPKVKHPKAGDVLAAGSVTEVTWDTPEGPPAQSVTLRLSLDGGATWQVEAEGLVNSGSYSWTVPIVSTTMARLEVILVYGEDETGVIPESEFACSDAFSILSPTAVEGPRAFLALQPSNPVVGPFTVSFSLASDAPATLAVYDVGGRAVASREVGPDGAGWHTIHLGSLPAGMYVVRLTQSGRTLTSRVAAIR